MISLATLRYWYRAARVGGSERRGTLRVPHVQPEVVGPQYCDVVSAACSREVSVGGIGKSPPAPPSSTLLKGTLSEALCPAAGDVRPGKSPSLYPSTEGRRPPEQLTEAVLCEITPNTADFRRQSGFSTCQSGDRASQLCGRKPYRVLSRACQNRLRSTPIPSACPDSRLAGGCRLRS